MKEDETPDFLSDEPSSAPEIEASEAREPKAAPAKTEPAASAPPSPAGPAASPEPQASGAEDPQAVHNVPLSTFLDMRDRLAAAEREKKELADWRKQQEAVARQQPVPDRNTDPEAFEDWRSQQFVSQLRGQTMNFSRRMAVKDYGAETVDAAYQWGVTRCDQDPLFNQRVAQSDDPYELVVSEWKKEQTLSRIGENDLDAFLAWKASQPAGQPPQVNHNPAPAIRASPAAPRPSLASAPAASRSSGPEAKDGEATFDSMFG